ncbi:hypothetical protein AVEN_130075-1 [Araneus ventricosus]|uniref:Transposon Ty3-I Gag-Pol polyprotein n=1 Tax=Araneus ventricosus TaxID=182803 RepID=A0A4Y2EK30_ARAVE|nr:hypothetical protein AVEN_130075-1 [Araneus ventricosus]
MVTHAYEIPAPEVFSLQSEDWSKGIARFKRLRTASGLINKPEAEQDALRKKLDEMIKQEIIEPVDEASEWCAPMVIVSKKQGDIRICVDLPELNKKLQRETYPIASENYILA